MKKYIIFIVLLSFVSAACFAANYNPDKTGSFKLSPRNKKEIKITAARGYSSNFPENTVTAVIKAAETGCDFIMLDVRSTKDNVPVALKDAELDRTTNTVGNIKDKTFQELSSYQAGYPDVFGEAFAEESIPSLEYIFGNMRRTKFMLNIYNAFDIPLVRDAMRKAKYSEKNAVFTFNSLNDITTATGAKLAALMFYRNPLPEYFASDNKSAWLTKAKKSGTDGFIVTYTDMFNTLSSSQRGVFMVQCSKEKLPVYIIGAESSQQILNAMEYQLKGLIGKRTYIGKFAGIITNDPGRAMLAAGRLKSK